VEFFGYFASLFMGVVLGLIGGGGSILTVLILVYLFQINAVLATAYSLFIVGITALIGGVSFAQRGLVDFKTGFVFALPSFVGVYLTRAFLVPWIPDPVFVFSDFVLSKSFLILSIFSVLMLMASISMIRGQKPKGKTLKKELSPKLKGLIIVLEGLVIGFFTGLVGAGGGFLIIPALVVLVGLPMKVAVGTSLFIIAAKSLLGFIGDVQAQPMIDWEFLFFVSLASSFGIFFGMRLSSYLSESLLKKGFGFFVFFMGLIILVDQVYRL